MDFSELVWATVLRPPKEEDWGQDTCREAVPYPGERDDGGLPRRVAGELVSMVGEICA